MVLICGLPNAGKTTYSSRYSNVLHYDDISRYRQAERIEIYRRTDAECIEGIYNTVAGRKRILDNVRAERKVCIWIDTPPEVCIARETRGRGEHIVLSHAKMFEPPTLDEGWDEIIIIRN